MPATSLFMSPILVAVGALSLIAFAGSAIIVCREKTMPAFAQLVGAALLVVVVLTHVAETFEIWPGMGWGRPDSAGHDLDLFSVIGGSILFSGGWLLRRARKR
ncbi:MAG: hypothetical protein ACREFL_03380 [Stellaceae bacterium]